MHPSFTIAHYRITSKLGEGGMGAVYRATDTRLGRDVAIKVLPDAFAENPDRMARFTREAKVLASLNHPNIAGVYGVEDRAIVMELVEGADLKGPLPLETALDYAGQIADALEAAHEKGITHRDLKPANIKVTPQGLVKVLDFGLAKVAAPATGDAMNSPTLTIGATEAGVIMGTAAYMSPEQARGQEVDKRADIWAFGVILWEMLTGRQMFSGATTADILAAVLTGSPDLQAVPAQVRPLLEACLEKDPRQRLCAAGDWRRLTIAAVPDGSARVRSRGGDWMPWLIAGIAVASAGVTAVALWPKQANGADVDPCGGGSGGSPGPAIQFRACGQYFARRFDGGVRTSGQSRPAQAGHAAHRSTRDPGNSGDGRRRQCVFLTGQPPAGFCDERRDLPGTGGWRRADGHGQNGGRDSRCGLEPERRAGFRIASRHAFPRALRRRRAGGPHQVAER